MVGCETCHNDLAHCPKQQALKADAIFGFNNETGEVTSNSIPLGICTDVIGMADLWTQDALDAWIPLANCTDEELINLFPQSGISRTQAPEFWRDIKPLLDNLRQILPRK